MLEILLKTYGDRDKNKKVKLHALKRQFKCFRMDEEETIVDYFDKTQELMKAKGACKDTISDQYVVDKILTMWP